MSTMECSCRLCPTPGIYEVTSSPLVSRTRATFRSAELGFFGVVVYTRIHTPRFFGQDSIAGFFDFFGAASRPFRTSWLIVGITPLWMWHRHRTGANTITLYLMQTRLS